MSLIQPVSLRDQSVPTSEGDAKVGDVRLYNFAGNEGLSLGQLVNAVCVHAGVAIEDQTVNKMNIITVNARRLKAETKVVGDLLSGAGSYDSTLDVSGYEGMTYRDFLQNVLKLTIGGNGTLPATLDSYNNRMKVYTAMKELINADATASQQDMIDLQTYESRRDVAYSTATNIVKNLGMSKQMVSSNMR